PLWQKKGGENNPELLADIFELLRKEFVLRRKLILRIRPFIFSDEVIYNHLKTFDRYKLVEALAPYKTLVLYLNTDIQEIRKQLNHRWRKGLNKSERKDLKLKEGIDPKLYSTLIDIYHQMHSRKKYKEYVNVERVGRMNDNLDDEFKLMIFIAYKDDIPIAALAGSALGGTGIGLLGGITEIAMKNQASYLLQWEMIKYFKNIGCEKYDLGGIDPQKNPSVFYFKQGISEIEVLELGIFEASYSYFFKVLLRTVEKLKKISHL
ncbi:MAG: peptidoglycan bridge formation glycyltransferase FemA/FemB family protein, partial [Candidatus Lokiarchaeota archaeon]|nr:peptidoglycan bridge formation glycyltransferase FemA/FemB family protein [Candidatus Lokiarchaeota archaeon]